MKVMLLTLSLLLLTGCGAQMSFPFTHEIESTLLMSTLGVDVGTESVDGVGVTASSGARSGAGTQTAQTPVVLSAQADTITAACQEIQSLGNELVFFGDVEQLLIGEGQAQRSLDAVLTHVGRDRELRLEAQLWVVRGGSAANLLFPAAEEGGAGERLEAISMDAGIFSDAIPKTAREALVELSRNNCTFVPALARTESRPGDGTQGEGAIVPAGYALFRDGVLAGWADGEASRGINLLLGRVDTDILEVTTPDRSRMALRITGAKTAVAPQMEEGTLMGLTITCKLEAAIAERRGAAVLDDKTLDWLEARLSAVTGDRIQEALELAQSLDADFLCLGQGAALAAPWDKKELATQWNAIFSKLPITLDVRAQVTRE